jgi:hypothetical protein
MVTGLSAGCAGDDESVRARQMLDQVALVSPESYRFREEPIGEILACVTNARSIQGDVDTASGRVWFTDEDGEPLAFSGASGAFIHRSLLEGWSIDGDWVRIAEDDSSAIWDSVTRAVGDEMAAGLRDPGAAPSPAGYANALLETGSRFRVEDLDDGGVVVSASVLDGQLGALGDGTADRPDLDVRITVDAEGAARAVTVVLAAPAGPDGGEEQPPVGVLVSFDDAGAIPPTPSADASMLDAAMIPTQVTLRRCG